MPGESDITEYVTDDDPSSSNNGAKKLWEHKGTNMEYNI